jgi:uncharacterized integral membrane protein (TIGR00697 family)
MMPYLTADTLWFLFFAFNIISLFGFYKYGRLIGLSLFMALSVIIANLQLLKTVSFFWFPHPVALGTTSMAFTYLCTDAITEFYGPKAAQKSVWLSFLAHFFFSTLMAITTLYPSSASHTQQAFEQLFFPMIDLMVAGLGTYVISQYADIYFFNYLKHRWQAPLWLRSFVSTVGSAIIDTLVFNVLAWVVLKPIELDQSELIYSYMLGTLCFRIVLAAFNAPLLHWLKKCHKTLQEQN